MSQATKGAVVVTGASSGIGKACALRLARAGYHVFAGVRRQADQIALQAAGRDRITPLLLDVTDQAGIDAAAARVVSIAGDTGLAGLVNNAGIAVGSPLEFVPIEDLRRQLEVNVIGQIAVTQALLPLLRAARGRIVFMGSISGLMTPPFLGPYSASKFALEALTDALRIELRPWGIEVCIVEPGGIATPIWDKSLAAAADLERRLPPHAQQLYGEAIAAVRTATLRRVGAGIPPDRVARVVLHAIAASRPRTRYVVGGRARLRILLAGHLPDRLRDRLIVRAMQLPDRG